MPVWVELWCWINYYLILLGNGQNSLSKTVIRFRINRSCCRVTDSTNHLRFHCSWYNRNNENDGANTAWYDAVLISIWLLSSTTVVRRRWWWMWAAEELLVDLGSNTVWIFCRKKTWRKRWRQIEMTKDEERLKVVVGLSTFRLPPFVIALVVSAERPSIGSFLDVILL